MNRIVRVIPIVLVALGLGYAVFGSGLDRMSASNPALVATVPQSFRAAAWRSAVAVDSARGHPAAARDKARAAIAADPMDAAASSGLGLAEIALHRGVAAEGAFRIAGRLGWRDKPTQIYWMAVSADSGAYALAVQRADALFRQDEKLIFQPRLLAKLESTAGGRKALAASLATRPNWFGYYWNLPVSLDPNQLIDRAKVLDEPTLRPPVVACADVRGFASSVEKIDMARSRSILDRFCRRPGGALLTDGSFTAARLANDRATGWQFTGAGGLDVRIDKRTGLAGRAVTVSSMLPQRQIFASQLLQLGAGRYRVGWRTPGRAGNPAPGIAVRLTCQQDAGEYLVAASGGGDRMAASAEIAANCPLQWLDLAIDPAAASVTVDDVTIQRVD